MMPILIKGDDVRSGTKANARYMRHGSQWVQKTHKETFSGDYSREFLHWKNEIKFITICLEGKMMKGSQ